MGRRRTEAPAQPDQRRRAGVAVLVAVLIGSSAGAALGLDRTGGAHLYPGTRIGDVVIGSRSVTEAEGIVHEKFVLPLRDEVTLTAPQFEHAASAWDWGMRVDANDVVRDVHAQQRSGSLPTRVWHRIFGDERNHVVEPTLDESVFDQVLGDTIAQVNREPRDAELRVNGDELEVVPHELGRTVDGDEAAERIFSALQNGSSKVALPVEVIEPELMAGAFDTAILISTTANTLKFYTNGELSKTYNVATGTGGHPTPHGQWRITVKRPNPTWYNPGSPWSQGMPAFIPPGPNNPLGTRALNLNASGIRIHGTPESDSIGTNASHGCIRMLMHEAEELFELVDVGTPVLVTG